MTTDSSALRDEFVRLLTQDGPTRDRRRRDYNQAIFMDNGEPVWSSTDLGMVLEKFDAAVRNLTRKGTH